MCWWSNRLASLNPQTVLDRPPHEKHEFDLGSVLSSTMLAGGSASHRLRHRFDVEKLIWPTWLLGRCTRLSCTGARLCRACRYCTMADIDTSEGGWVHFTLHVAAQGKPANVVLEHKSLGGPWQVCNLFLLTCPSGHSVRNCFEVSFGDSAAHAKPSRARRSVCALALGDCGSAGKPDTRLSSKKNRDHDVFWEAGPTCIVDKWSVTWLSMIWMLAKAC